MKGSMGKGGEFLCDLIAAYNKFIVFKYADTIGLLIIFIKKMR